MVRIIRAMVMIGLVIGLSGCMSVNRKTPFKELDAVRHSADFQNEDTVNLWPVYLRSGDVSSYLWPIIKHEPGQFAIRPLYNYDDGTHDLLLGIGSADFGRREYRLFPFIWYFPERYFGMLFPIGYYDGESKTRAAGSPLIYNRVWDSKTGKTELSTLTLLWKGETRRNGDYDWGLFPLYWSFTSQRSRHRTLFPLYFSSTYKDSHSRVLFPLYWSFTDDDERTRILFPLYWRYTDKTSLSETLFPIWHRQINEKTEGYTYLTPLGGVGLDWWATPLVGRGKTWSYFLTAGTSTREDLDKGTKVSAKWFLPFWYAEEDVRPNRLESYWWTPLLFHNEYTRLGSSRYSRREWATFPLYSFTNATSIRHITGADQPYEEKRFRWTTLLFLNGSTSTSQDYHNRKWEVSLLDWLLSYRHDTYTFRYDREANKRQEDKDAPSLYTFVPEEFIKLNSFLHTYRRRGDSVDSYYLWGLLYDYARRGDERVEFDSLVGLLYDYNREGKDKAEQGDFSILRHLFRYRWSGEGDAQGYAFPGVAWNRSSDGASGHSFLWKVWRREKSSSGKRRYTFLFIPFGDQLD